MKIKSLVLVVLSCLSLNLLAQDITLPTPVNDGGMGLMSALARRRSQREFDSKELPLQMLSTLLWAADGISGKDGRRTAPTGLNVQDLDIYVVMAKGIYLFNCQDNVLKLVKEGDFRKSAGRQPFVAVAPVNLIYVQNLDKAMKTDSQNTARHGGIHAGAVMQNVYLFCAANGLSCVARDSMDRSELTSLLSLSPRQSIILAQTVGFPKAKN